MEFPVMRGPSRARNTWQRETSRFVSWLHKRRKGNLPEGEGTNAWTRRRFVSQEEIRKCRWEKSGRAYARVSRENAPYSNGWMIWEPGYYRVEPLEERDGRTCCFMRQSCADGFPHNDRNALKQMFRDFLSRREKEVSDLRREEYWAWSDGESERKAREIERDREERQRAKTLAKLTFPGATREFFQSLAIAGSINRKTKGMT